MAPRDKLPHTSNWAPDLQLSRSTLTQPYDWLRPAESPLALSFREGPLRRLRPTRLKGDQLPALGAPTASASSCGPVQRRQKNLARRPRSDIWATGSQAPNWCPSHRSEREHRQTATSAVQAFSSVHGRVPPPKRSLPRSSSCPGRCAAPARTLASIQVENTPGIEAWDSVSQAPSAESPRTSHGGDRDLVCWDVRSAETCTATGGPYRAESETDRQIREHLARNRGGWYDMHNGRFFG